MAPIVTSQRGCVQNCAGAGCGATATLWPSLSHQAQFVLQLSVEVVEARSRPPSLPVRRGWEKTKQTNKKKKNLAVPLT